MNLWRRLDAWFFAPAPARRLAALRIAIGAFGFCYLLARAPHWLNLQHMEAHGFKPVGIASWLSAPLAAPWLYISLVVALIGATLFVSGFRHRVVGPAYAVSLLWVTSYRNSWGMIFHVENLLVLHTLVLGCSQAADAWSLEKRQQASLAEDSQDYGWPLKTLMLLTCLSYVLAGVAKLDHAGFAWANGDILREHVAYDALRKLELGAAASPIGVQALRHSWLFPPLAWLTLLFELGAPLALLGQRSAAIWCFVAWSFHLGVLALMGIVFPYPLLGFAYLPFFPVERWLHRRHFPRPTP